MPSWTFRRKDHYWIANQESVLARKKIDVSTTTDITGIAATPRKLDKGQQQWWGITARRPRHLAFTYQRRAEADTTPTGTTFNQSVSGTLAITDIVGTLTTDFIGFPNPWTDNIEERSVVTNRSRRPHAAFFQQRKPDYNDTSVTYNQSLSGTFAGAAPTSPSVLSGSYSEFSGVSAISKPSSGVVGDCYMVVLYDEPTTYPDNFVISGFTRIVRDGDSATFTQDIQQDIWYRWHDGTEGSTFSVTSGPAAYGAIWIVRGADNTIAPIAGTVTKQDQHASPATVRGIKTFSDHNLLLVIQNDWDSDGGTLACSGYTRIGGHSINNIVTLFAKQDVAAGDQAATTTTWSGGVSTFATVTSIIAFAPGKPAALVVPTIVDPQTNIGAISTITKPLYGQTGDYYVISMENENASVPSTVGVTGFTSCGYVTALDSPSGITQTFLVLYRAHDGTEGSTFSFVNQPGFVAAECFIVRGANASTPLFNNAQAATSSGSLSLSGVTTVVDNSLGIIMTHSVQSNNIDVSGWTSAGAWDSGTGERFSKTLTTAGATGTATVTYTTSSNALSAGIIAFAPLAMSSSSGITGTLTTLYIPAGADVITPRQFEMYMRTLTPRRHQAYASMAQHRNFDRVPVLYTMNLSGIFV